MKHRIKRRNSVFIRYLIVSFLLCSPLLYSDWNEDFDTQSTLLIHDIPALQHPKYLKHYAHFKSIRDVLTNDASLIKQIQAADPGKKLMVNKKNINVIIKKRRNNHIHDAYAWELSYLLGSNRYVLPSFPMEIGGIRVIVQKLESFEFANKNGDGYSKGLLKKISLETYWKAHLQAFLLGFSDLASANIGVNSKGVIRFFDNEASLIYYNTPFKNELCFSTGFVCQSFDWPQYNTSIDSTTAESLRNFVEGLSNYEETLKIYAAHRPVFMGEEGVKHRLNIIRNFNFQTGVTFRDFYAAVFPRLSAGLDEMNQIANRIMKRNVGHGSTLFFSCRRIKDYKLSPQDKAEIQQWVNRYIE